GKAGRDLAAARDRLVHVDALGELVHQRPVAIVHTLRAVGAAGEAAIRQARTGGDLVLELVIEEREGGREAGEVVIAQAELVSGARFRLQSGTADGGPGALAGEARDPVGDLVEPRHLETAADPALEGPVSRDIPHQIASRA